MSMRAVVCLAFVLPASVVLTTVRADRRDIHGFSKAVDWVPNPTPTPRPSRLVPSVPVLFAATSSNAGKLDAHLNDQVTEVPTLVPASATPSTGMPSTRRRVGLGHSFSAAIRDAVVVHDGEDEDSRESRRLAGSPTFSPTELVNWGTNCSWYVAPYGGTGQPRHLATH